MKPKIVHASSKPIFYSAGWLIRGVIFPSKLKDIFLILVKELARNRQETETKCEFDELKQVVKELADAQKK